MKTRGMKRQMVGKIVKDRMDKTVVVRIERMVKHRFYHKYIRRRATYAAHDERNECKIGDKVVITESRPLSKTKRWRVARVLEKAV